MKNKKLDRIERIKISNDLDEHKELINRIIKWLIFKKFNWGCQKWKNVKMISGHIQWEIFF